MISSAARRVTVSPCCRTAAPSLRGRQAHPLTWWRANSSSIATQDQESRQSRAESSSRAHRYSLNKDGDVVVSPEHQPDSFPERSERTTEVLRFPASSNRQGYPRDDAPTQPVLLNAKEHVVGYLSRILNARVYDVCIETELQHARNLSAVRPPILPNIYHYRFRA